MFTRLHLPTTLYIQTVFLSSTHTLHSYKALRIPHVEMGTGLQSHSSNDLHAIPCLGRQTWLPFQILVLGFKR